MVLTILSFINMIYWFSFDLKNKIQEKIENRKRLIIIYIFNIIFLVNFLFNGSYATIIIMVEYDNLDVVLSKIVVQSVEMSHFNFTKLFEKIK